MKGTPAGQSLRLRAARFTRRRRQTRVSPVIGTSEKLLCYVVVGGGDRPLAAENPRRSSLFGGRD